MSDFWMAPLDMVDEKHKEDIPEFSCCMPISWLRSERNIWVRKKVRHLQHHLCQNKLRKGETQGFNVVYRNPNPGYVLRGCWWTPRLIIKPSMAHVQVHASKLLECLISWMMTCQQYGGRCTHATGITQWTSLHTCEYYTSWHIQDVRDPTCWWGEPTAGHELFVAAATLVIIKSPSLRTQMRQNLWITHPFSSSSRDVLLPKGAFATME